MNKFPSLPFIPIKGEREFFQHLDESADLRDEIAVMGGDGTVNMAVQKLFGTKTALGIIRPGTEMILPKNWVCRRIRKKL